MKCASMGPRSCERGNLMYHLACCKFNCRFNGAALVRARKSLLVGLLACDAALRFNGAALVRARK